MPWCRRGWFEVTDDRFHAPGAGEPVAHKKVPRIPVPVADLRKMRYLVETASRLVHSNARMLRDEKLLVLRAQAALKKYLDDILQLSLFPSSQLEE